MSLASSVQKAIFNCNGTSGPFTFSFPFLDNAHIKIYLDDEPQSESVHYTLTGAGSPYGGSVSLTAAPSSGVLVIERIIPLDQPTVLVDQGPFYATTHESAFDRMVMQIQQTWDRASRGIRYPMSIPGGGDIHADQFAARNNKVVGFNTQGDLALLPSNYVTSTGELSNPWADVRGYASLAAAIATLGGMAIDLVIWDAQSVTADLTVPENIRLFVLMGGTINVAAGKTLTINGPLDAGDFTVFTGTGAVAGLKAVNPIWFGAEVDGTTDDTAAYTRAMNSLTDGGRFSVPVGVSILNNVLLKSNTIIEGEGKGSILKLKDDVNMNILSTLANHDTNSDGGVRAADPNNATYMLENVTIRNIYFDGNKANNTHGDNGGNDSAMGAAITLMNARNVIVEHCWLTNCRLDGVHIGYSLQGGSDDCVIKNNTIADNGRTGIAQITGKRNQIIGNVVTGSLTSLDVESNLEGEINWKHKIMGNHFEGTVAFNALAGYMQDCIFANNTIVSASTKHGLWLQGGDQTAGMEVYGNNLVGSGAGSAAFNIVGGINSTGKPLSITNNTVGGYDYITSAPVLTINNIHFKGNVCATKYGFQLMRPFRVNIADNALTFDGGDSTGSIFYVQFSDNGVVPDQGEVYIHNNRIRGSGVKRLLASVTGYTPPMFTSTQLVVSNNDFDVTSILNEPMIDIDQDTTLRGNRFFNFNHHIKFLGSNNGSRFIDNEFINTSGTAFNLFEIPSIFKRTIISNNKLSNINLYVVRPQYCDISGNTIRNGKLEIAYLITSGGAGANTISGNRMITDTTIDYAFKISGVENTDWASGDFSGNDIIMGNTHAGPYAAGASLNTTPQTANYNSF